MIKETEESLKEYRQVCDDLEAEAAYELLAAEPSCTDSELAAAYHRKAAYWHPDRLQATNIPIELTEHAARELARINEAYGIRRNLRSIPKRS